MGELGYLHRGLLPPALLPRDMEQHPQVAAHVLNWLLDRWVRFHSIVLFLLPVDNRVPRKTRASPVHEFSRLHPSCNRNHLDDVLTYGASSATAQTELERLFAHRPDKPQAVKLAWMHHIQQQAFGRATRDVRALADGEPALELKRLWVSLGVLADEAAVRGGGGGKGEEQEVRLSMREDQDLLAAQQRLAAMLLSGEGKQRRLGGASEAAAAVLEKGGSLDPGLTVRALVEQVAGRGAREQAVAVACMAMDLLDYYVGRRGLKLNGVVLEEVVCRVWAALVDWRRDWDGAWRQCDSRVDAGAGARGLEGTAFAMVGLLGSI